AWSARARGVHVSGLALLAPAAYMCLARHIVMATSQKVRLNAQFPDWGLTRGQSEYLGTPWVVDANSPLKGVAFPADSPLDVLGWWFQRGLYDATLCCCARGEGFASSGRFRRSLTPSRFGQR